MIYLVKNKRFNKKIQKTEHLLNDIYCHYSFADIYIYIYCHLDHTRSMHSMKDLEDLNGLCSVLTLKSYLGVHVLPARLNITIDVASLLNGRPGESNEI